MATGSVRTVLLLNFLHNQRPSQKAVKSCQLTARAEQEVRLTPFSYHYHHYRRHWVPAVKVQGYVSYVFYFFNNLHLFYRRAHQWSRWIASPWITIYTRWLVHKGHKGKNRQSKGFNVGTENIMAESQHCNIDKSTTPEVLGTASGRPILRV